MAASSISLMALGFALSLVFPYWHWDHYPFHAMLEGVGSLSALTIATLIIILINNNRLSRRFIVVSAALISVGLLDGFHAVLHAGISFVWLHSIATLAGGLIFSALWLPETWWTKKATKLLDHFFDYIGPD